MAPSFAELKQKAAKAKDATTSTFQNTRDRYSSVPLKKTNWDPYNKNPTPPPGHAQTNSVSSTSTQTKPQPSYPPPPSRASRPAIPAQTTEEESPRTYSPPTLPTRAPRPPIPARKSEPVTDVDSIDWANLTAEDKEVFFSWLDEFFARFLSLPTHTNGTIKRSTPSHPAPLSAPTPQAPPIPATRGPPPKIATWNRPNITPNSSSNDVNAGTFVLSHPPPTIHGSSALDLAYYFEPSTYWDSAWYAATDNIVPPPIRGSTHITSAASWHSSGPKKSFFVGILFSDLSICWGSVECNTASNADPNDNTLVKRGAEYLPRPRALDKATLVEAHETYGETIAAFAEGFAGTGQFCARGECWDLANEALKYFNDFDYVPKPIPSLSRTHGHLIFEGKAMSRGNMVGRWRGGDDRVRRGDIVEWRKVKINVVNARPGSWAKLGDPDHTAVIVRDSEPSRTPVDGQSLSPMELGSLEVVEQSVKSPPERKEYDLSAFEEGEMWIYRPVSMQVYLGTLFEAKCPPGVQTLRI